MRVLSLYDRTGNWSRPWAEAGHEVVTVDLQPSAWSHPNRTHLQADVRDLRLDSLPRSFERKGADVVLCAPPCTVFSNAGAQWQRTREQMHEALGQVDACLRLVHALRPKVWALENPNGKLVRYLGPPVFRFDPCDFAQLADTPEEEAYTKRTCLWGSFIHPEAAALPPLLGSKMHRMPDTKERANKRSATPLGFARAFCRANVWHVAGALSA